MDFHRALELDPANKEMRSFLRQFSSAEEDFLRCDAKVLLHQQLCKEQADKERSRQAALARGQRKGRQTLPCPKISVACEEDVPPAHKVPPCNGPQGKRPPGSLMVMMPQRQMNNSAMPPPPPPAPTIAASTSSISNGGRSTATHNNQHDDG